MGPRSETQDQSGNSIFTEELQEGCAPGLVLVFACGRAASELITIDGGSVELGRDLSPFPRYADARISRRHARVDVSCGTFTVTDLKSRNGTSCDGERLDPGVTARVSRVLRIGDSLLVPADDAAVFQQFGVRVEGQRVEGPALQRTLLAAARAAKGGSTLHITGESGAGKEGVARAFHAAGPAPNGPFQAVNCATIPESVAERLLFGAKRGAYSGADSDADGYLQSAHGGTLFLDEVAELTLPVQSKLLRVLETSEVLSLGAVRPRKVDLRVCSATHRDLRAQVAEGKLRQDLYFRMATPSVAVPPLRHRLEEIPWLLQSVVAQVAPELSIHWSLVEACLLRPWPGNVRELCAEARSAAQAATGESASRVEAKHLGQSAGLPFETVEERAQRTSEPAPSERRLKSAPSRAKITALLRRHEGNVSRAARELGVHRTQLRRWIEEYGLNARSFAPDGRNKEVG